jgi:hypothetical protein
MLLLLLVVGGGGIVGAYISSGPELPILRYPPRK